ncbi:STAS domain-containing protein [Streptomyces sp. NPDC005840]|uniref:STAS domain-containing protein n=1 Tax=Streptomyces sp. NPDC005840 TaxID=3157072 RepID=UPI0033EE7B3D
MAERDAAHAAGHHTAPHPGADPVVPGTATVVSLHGEIDLPAVLALSDRLDDLTAHAHPALVLDLRSVDFIDCAGLGALCRVRNRILARRGRLLLVTESRGFHGLLRATGLGGAFEVVAALPRPLHGPGPCGPGATPPG